MGPLAVLLVLRQRVVRWVGRQRGAPDPPANGLLLMFILRFGGE